MSTIDWSEHDQKNFSAYLKINSFRSVRHRLFYVAVPKVACTTLKWWFATLEGYAGNLGSIANSRQSEPDLDIHHSDEVAPNVTGLPLSEISDAIDSEEYFRFAVVRNPYKRIFSAWQSKLLLQESFQSARYVHNEFYLHPIITGADIAMAFEGFIEHLAKNEAPSYWNYHWTPQADLLRPDLINYSCLVKIEESDRLTQELAVWLGTNINSPFHGPHLNESIIPYSSEFVTERSADLIRTLYARDFDIFRYEKQIPKINTTFSIEQCDIAIKAIKLIRGRNQRLGERYQYIANLNQVISEYEDRIASLSHILSECKVQISNLNQIVSERDSIKSANEN